MYKYYFDHDKIGPSYFNLLATTPAFFRYILGNKDVKTMENFTIILIGCMTLALKVLAMFTLSMGSLTLK